MIRQATPATISEAAALLQQGGLVAFPTETVYGLGASALDGDAVARLYELKQRPRHKAFSIMVPDLAAAEQLAVFDARARSLANVFWPGPLSIVLPVKPDNTLSPAALAGQNTISLRVPRQPTALALLKACNLPLAVPSANASGHLSATTAAHVAHDFGDGAPFVLADAVKPIGIESTIVDLTQIPAVILRQGAISIEEIAALIGDVVLQDNDDTVSYQLNTPLRLNAVDVKTGEAFLGFGNLNYIGVQDIGFVKNMPASHWRNLSPNGDLHEAAAHIYAMLHELDQLGATSIAVMRLPEHGLGITLNDRLRRAAARDIK